MAKLRLKCPQSHVLEVDVIHVGKKVQCPLCQTVMLVPELPRARLAATAGSPAPRHQKLQTQQEPEVQEQEFEEEERPRQKLPGTKAGLKKVRTGLNYLIAQLYVKVIGVLVLLVVGLVVTATNVAAIAKAQGDVQQVQGFGIISALGVIFSLSSMVLGILSCLYILGMPERTRARGLAIGYVVLTISASTAGIFGYLAQENNGLVALLRFLEPSLLIASYFCFILLLIRLSEFIKKSKLAAKARGLLIMLGVVIGGYVIIFLSALGTVAAAGPNKPEGMGLAALGFLFGGLLVFILGIWSFFRFLGLLHRVRDAL